MATHGPTCRTASGPFLGRAICGRVLSRPAFPPVDFESLLLQVPCQVQVVLLGSRACISRGEEARTSLMQTLVLFHSTYLDFT